MKRLLATFIATALLTSACGGSDADPASSSTQDTSAMSDSTSTSAATSDAEAPSLAGTSWTVTTYQLPDGGLTNTWKADVTISFAADGTVSGSAGCNDYSGTWTVSGDWNEFESGVPDPQDGQELALSALSWTEIGCEDADVMQQESEILGLLQQAGRWVLIRDSFNLRDASGAFLFEAEAS